MSNSITIKIAGMILVVVSILSFSNAFAVDLPTTDSTTIQPCYLAIYNSAGNVVDWIADTSSVLVGVSTIEGNDLFVPLYETRHFDDTGIDWISIIVGDDGNVIDWFSIIVTFETK